MNLNEIFYGKKASPVAKPVNTQPPEEIAKPTRRASKTTAKKETTEDGQ